MVNARQYLLKLSMHILYDPAILILCLHNRNECYVYPPARNNQKWTKYTKQWKTVTPMRWKMNESSPIIALIYCFEEFSSMWHKEEEPRQRLADGLSWRDRAEPRENKVIKILRPRWWRRENPRDLQRLRREYLAEYFSPPMCEEMPWGQRKNHSKWTEETILRAHTELGIVPVPTSQPGKPQDSGGIG